MDQKDIQQLQDELRSSCAPLQLIRSEVGRIIACGDVSHSTTTDPSTSCAAQVSGRSLERILGQGFHQPRRKKHSHSD